MIRPLVGATSVVVAGGAARSFRSAAQPQSQPDEPVANPGRPTVSTPATLTPVGYLQFETGYLAAWHSPEFSSQSSFNEVVKFSVTRRIELLAAAGPFAHSRAGNQTANGTGDVALGVQGVVHQGEGARPTIALSYFRRVYSGDAPDLDIGSARNSMLLLASADVKGFHYDTNYLFNEVIDECDSPRPVRADAFGFASAGEEIRNLGRNLAFHPAFSAQPCRRQLVGAELQPRKNLVIDGGFNHGLTSTSTRWEVFVGFTYLLPHKILARSGAN